jgi:hypothetical protein
MPVMPATLRGSSGTIQVLKPSDRPALAAGANGQSRDHDVVVQHVR